MIRKLTLVAMGAAVLLGGCAKTENATTTTTVASASSGTTEAPTTTEKSSGTTSKKGTTTTKKSTSGTKSTKKDPKVERIVEAQREKADSAGVELGDAEIACMEGYLEETPELIDLIGTGATTKAEWEEVFGMIAACVDKEVFVDLSLGEMRGLTAAQKACFKDLMMDLSVEEFAGLAAQDPETIDALSTVFATCV